MTPTIVVQRDYDGYFEKLVRDLVAKKGDCKHSEIRIDSGPYRSYAVAYASKDGILELDFYSAIRTGFGSFTDADRAGLMGVL